MDGLRAMHAAVSEHHWITAWSVSCDNSTLPGVRCTLWLQHKPGKLRQLLSHLPTSLRQFPWLLSFHKVNGRHQIHQSIATVAAGRAAPRHALSPRGVSANLATAVGGLTLISAVGSRPLVYLSSLSRLHTGFNIANDASAINAVLLLFPGFRLNFSPQEERSQLNCSQLCGWSRAIRRLFMERRAAGEFFSKIQFCGGSRRFRGGDLILPISDQLRLFIFRPFPYLNKRRAQVQFTS